MRRNYGRTGSSRTIYTHCESAGYPGLAQISANTVHNILSSNDYCGLSINPFDKQNIKEKDAFRSGDHKEMFSRLEYLKTVRGIGVFTARLGVGKTYALHAAS